MVNRLDLEDKLIRIDTLADRGDYMMEDLTRITIGLEHEKATKSDIHHAAVISETAFELFQEIRAVCHDAEKLIAPVKDEEHAKPEKDHENMVKGERIDEILNQVNIFVGMIENFPDWLDRMKTLNFAAQCLAMGVNGYNFTCKEPGRD